MSSESGNEAAKANPALATEITMTSQ